MCSEARATPRALALALLAASAGGLAACGAETGDLLTREATTFYLSPTGSDDNAGTTEAAPWRHFVHALPMLAPGGTLVLEDGTYDGTTTGYLQVSCGTNGVNGTPDAPITVRAQNERQALLAGDGVSGAPIELSGCANWVVAGLHATGADVSGPQGAMGDEPGSVVVLTHACTNVLLSRVVADHPNQYQQASVYVVAHAATGVVIEESEALDFHTYGFHAYDSMHPIFRRDYAHSRDEADLPGGAVTASPTNGDGGFLLTKSLGGVIEDCIAEHVADGFTLAANHGPVGGQVQPQNDMLVGDVANDVTHAGFVLASHCANTKPCNEGDQIVSNAVLSNDVARGGALGVSITGGVKLTIESSSMFDATDTGVSFGLDAENMGLASSATARATLVTAAGAAFGFHATSFSRDNAYGPAMTFAPRDGHVMDGTEIDPQLGACLVSVPAGSPFAATAPGASGAGATIAYESVDGKLTTTKLWDQTTGQFPCGAPIAGVDDATRADVSCVGVAARLHVGTMGCAIP
jgi:hypothetical protein